MIALGLIGVGCLPAPSPGPSPTPEEAVAFLSQAVELARAGRWEDLCAIGSANCERALADAGKEAVPLDPPTVRRTWLVNSTAEAVGGRVLEVCGVDGRNEPYVTEILVFRLGSETRAIEPVYWSGIVIATDPVVGDEPAVLAPCPTG